MKSTDALTGRRPRTEYIGVIRRRLSLRDALASPLISRSEPFVKCTVNKDKLCFLPGSKYSDGCGKPASARNA